MTYRLSVFGLLGGGGDLLLAYRHQRHHSSTANSTKASQADQEHIPSCCVPVQRLETDRNVGDVDLFLENGLLMFRQVCECSVPCWFVSYLNNLRIVCLQVN